MATQDALTDVPGLRVGHAQRVGDDSPGWLTGTTVVLPPAEGAVAGVDSRGGAPGTRETDALDPRNVVERVHAIVLTGGSAFGLDSVAGAMSWLEEQGRGVRVGKDPAQVVPVVPAAVLFDLGRGGRWRARPDAALGREAVEAAAATPPGAPVAQGNVGAGTGAVIGAMKGGIGTASTVLPSGITVGALAAVNAAGSAVDPATGALYGEYGNGRPLRFPDEEVHARARRRLAEAEKETARRAAGDLDPGRLDSGKPEPGNPEPGRLEPGKSEPGGLESPFNTTLGVIGTDAVLTRPQAQKAAGTAHDGLARAIRPVHLMHDGDTVFTLATGRRALGEGELNDVLAASADVLARAVVKAALAAESVDGPGGLFPSYRDLYGGASG